MLAHSSRGSQSLTERGSAEPTVHGAGNTGRGLLCGVDQKQRTQTGAGDNPGSPQGPTSTIQVLTPKTYTASEEGYSLVLRTRACRDISGSNHGTTLPIQWPETWASLWRVCSVFE